MTRFIALLICWLLTTASPAKAVDVAAGGTRMRVEALTDSVLRVRIWRGEIPEDASWAVPPAVRGRSAAVRAMPDGFETSALRVRINSATLALAVTDLQGKVVHADAVEPLAFTGNGFALRKAMPVGERYFGLGDKTRAAGPATRVIPDLPRGGMITIAH